ncbi:MAG: VCBS repeat-containing protein [Bacteroidota bacterium]
MIRRNWVIYNSIQFLKIVFLICLLTACKQQPKTALFERLTAANSGIDFSNDINENDSVNLFANEYTYMGGGVGIGDFNNDGLPDIFFTGSQVSSQLYINEGGNHFKDITKTAGVATQVWVTGVSVIDINNDGYADIYLCVSGTAIAAKRKNLLFINNRDLTFTESAAAYGLDYSGYSTQAVFFDYDKDGDLDMFLLNHRLDQYSPNNIVPDDVSGRSPACDRLFRNTGINAKTGHLSYKDVSDEAGIKEDGYGLGIAVSDFNDDGWPDVYVSNDYLGNDELWLNNQNGTFTNCIAASLKHQSYSSMGVDAADVNNDGKIDIMTLDMMPENNNRKKTMYSFMSYERYQLERDAGYEPEFMRNMLQINNGTIPKCDTTLPFFSEIGQLAGVSETDWSWSVLFADFNNDGWKDIHITNGMERDLTNEDFVQFKADHLSDNFSTAILKRRSLMQKLEEYKSVDLRNYLFINNHYFGFENIAEEAGIDIFTSSNGAAYVDLDNDGDLDLVVNNISGKATVFINSLEKNKIDSNAGYINFILEGDNNNRDAIGTKISIFYNGERQVDEEFPVRGYLSTVDKILHFGVGNNQVIDSVVVKWPDDKSQILEKVSPNQTIKLNYHQAHARANAKKEEQHLLFSDVTAEEKSVYKHKETFFNDYSFQRLLTQKYSRLGPYISIADINNDGITDFFIGGAYNQSGKLFTQNRDGTFHSSDLIQGKKEEEDMGSLFFDANGDGFVDLMITGGSTEFSPGSPVYTPRLYINDGKFNLKYKAGAVPASINTSASVIASADIKGDGSTDIFIGGRISSNFPMPPRSYILHNDHGSLTDITDTVCPELKYPGMITSAVWTDFDNDHQTDLVITGEWMPIRFFKNNHGRLHEVTASTGLINTSGQWRSLIATDIDNDGDIDIIAGNLGSNCKYHVSPQQPLQLYSMDIDHNGSLDPIPFYYIKNKNGKKEQFPGLSRDQFAEQVPSIKKRFLSYAAYASAQFDDIFTKQEQQHLFTLTCEETRTCIFENNGNGKFIMSPLPVEAQFAPVNAILCYDFDGDGNKDLLLAGNEYQTEVMTGRYDASYGLLLKGNGKNNFRAVPPVTSGFIVNGDIKDMKMIVTANGDQLIIVAVNDGLMKIFRIKKAHPRKIERH